MHMCDTTRSYLWHNSFIYVTRLIHMGDTSIHVSDTTHSYVWHDSVTCVTWLIHICDMTHSYVRHDASKGTRTNESWHTYKGVMAHVRMSHGTRTKESWHTYKGVMAHVQMSHGTRTKESCLTWLIHRGRCACYTEMHAHIHEPTYMCDRHVLSSEEHDRALFLKRAPISQKSPHKSRIFQKSPIRALYLKSDLWQNTIWMYISKEPYI